METVQSNHDSCNVKKVGNLYFPRVARNFRFSRGNLQDFSNSS